MKNSVLTLAMIATSMTVVSCGVSTKAPKNDKDSAAYAIGVIIGQNAQTRLDSTLDYSILIEGVKDAYAKSADKKMKEMQAYMMGVQIGQSARGVDSTFDLAVIAAGVEDTFKNKAAIKAEEADGYIMGYISSKQNSVNDEYFAKVDSITGIQKADNGLRYLISNPGTDSKPTATDTIICNYTLYDLSDKVLDSSASRNEPFTVAPGGVVAGFSQGLLLLGKGGKATIWMPSELGYGDRGNGSVGPNQPLKFDIEVIDFKPAKKVK